MEENLIGRAIRTNLSSSKDGEKILLRNAYINNFLGIWDEVGIELLDEEKNRVTNAIWFHRQDIPELISELQKFV